MKTFLASETDVGKRLDVFVTENVPELSRSYIQRLCDTGKIKLNGIKELPKKLLKNGDEVILDFNQTSINQLHPLDLPIVYEDSDCLVINKPAGILTHSKGQFNLEPSVATFIKPKLKDLAGNRAGIVHRLDRATSGIIICAKNSKAQTWLQKQFSSRKVKKTYIAIVEGQLRPDEAVIDMPIERNPKNPKTFRVGDQGRPAQTAYKVLKTDSNKSFVELKPLTGRTHQLRVHLSQLGHPIVGDVLYGGKSADRMYLHAQDLEITLPDRQRKIFKTKLPAEFNKFLELKYEAIT